MWRQSRKYVKAVLNLITAVVILLFGRICCSIGYFVFYAFCNWLDHRDDCKPAGAFFG